MSEETTENTSENTETQETAQEPEKDIEYWKAQSRKWEDRSKANKSELDELKAKAAQPETEEESNDEEFEKEFGFKSDDKAGNEDKPAANEAAAEKASLEVARYKVGIKHGLSEEDVELFLTASTPELLEKQAEALSKRTAPKVKPDSSQGNRNGAGPKTPEAELDAFWDQFN